MTYKEIKDALVTQVRTLLETNGYAVSALLVGDYIIDPPASVAYPSLQYAFVTVGAGEEEEIIGTQGNPDGDEGDMIETRAIPFRVDVLFRVTEIAEIANAHLIVMQNLKYLFHDSTWEFADTQGDVFGVRRLRVKARELDATNNGYVSLQGYFYNRHDFSIRVHLS